MYDRITLYRQLVHAEKDVVRIAEGIVDLPLERDRDFSYHLQRLGYEFEHLTQAVKRLRDLRTIRDEETAREEAEEQND